MIRLRFCETCRDHVYHDKEYQGADPATGYGGTTAWLCRRCMAGYEPRGTPAPNGERDDDRGETYEIEPVVKWDDLFQEP